MYSTEYWLYLSSWHMKKCKFNKADMQMKCDNMKDHLAIKYSWMLWFEDIQSKLSLKRNCKLYLYTPTLAKSNKTGNQVQELALSHAVLIGFNLKS
jgi:hypothetical protein